MFTKWTLPPGFGDPFLLYPKFPNWAVWLAPVSAGNVLYLEVRRGEPHILWGCTKRCFLQCLDTCKCQQRM
jgi:hypothetical protein